MDKKCEYCEAKLQAMKQCKSICYLDINVQPLTKIGVFQSGDKAGAAFSPWHSSKEERQSD